MRVDFYQLSRDPVDVVAVLLARSTLQTGQRLLIVSGLPEQREAISKRLWEAKDQFLAHGMAGSAHDDRQPILISEAAIAGNSARFIALADGLWREEALAFDRVFLLFDSSSLEGARASWRMLGNHEGAERHFWKQDGGKWVEGP